MKKEDRFTSKEKNTNLKKLTILFSCIAGAIALILLLLILIGPAPSGSTNTTEPDVPGTTLSADTPTSDATVPSTEQETTVPEETKPEMLPNMAEVYAENSDLAGWLTVEGTILDYPVMYTPEDEEKYLYKNIKGWFDINGLLFIDDACSLDPESDNIIIFGHNMNSGKMFGSMMNYAYKYYWDLHPTIKFSTLYEEREYEIVAAFYDRVYYNYETCFKFYKFIDAKDEAHFNEAIAYFKEHAEYETGVTAEYGDRLITLVTCSEHTKNGRFVVVAREKTAAADAT